MRRRAPSLRGRLALLALASTAAWVTLLSLAFNAALAARLRDQVDQVLSTRASAVAATVDIHDSTLTVREPAHDEALDVGVWIFQGRTALVRPAAPGTYQRVADRIIGAGRRHSETSGPPAARLYALPLRVHGRQVGTVVVSAGLEPYRSTERTAMIGSLGVALLLLAGIYLVTRTIVDRALRPVHEMSAQATRWSETGTARRFRADDHPAELAQLAASLDKLLDRLAALLRHEQQLTAELSHELRTPLARIVAETDWLATRERDATQYRASTASIASSAAVMQQICETLLSDARAGAGTTARCVATDVARELARQRTDQEAPTSPVTVVGTAVTAGVPAALLTRILTPLLDNADRYARAHIGVECASIGGVVEIAVVDDGPGIPESVGDSVFDAGHRADPDDGHDGAGLGLALARRLARSAGGDITLDPSASGTRLVISLPPA